MKKSLVMLLSACALTASLSFGAMASDTGKTDLVIAMDADIETLHPTDFSTGEEIDILDQIYDSLMYMDPNGESEPEPRIAESYEISDDGLDYTFHLRTDVTFHDGNPVTAEDVVASIERYKESDYQGSQISMLSSVEATDDQTVVCHLDTPYAPFLAGIVSPYIFEKSYMEEDEDGFVNNPIGSGPYKFVSRSIGSNVVLEAYEDYYRGEAAIKNVTFTVIPEATTKAISLQTGEINFAEIDSSVLAQLEANSDITVEYVSQSGFAYVSMNTEKEPFNSVAFRQAVNYAINRENLVAVCYDDTAEVNSNICSKDRFGYSDDQFQYTYDPDKAAELLEEAGIETPYDLGTLLVAEKYTNLATVLQADLAAVGLNVEIAVEEFNSYIGDLTSGNYDITALTMTLEGDTQSLEMAFITDYIGTANNARYSDEEMDSLFDQTRSEVDTDKRLELFDTIFQKAQNEAIYAVLCNPQLLFAYNADLNVEKIPYEGHFYLYDFSWSS